MTAANEWRIWRTIDHLKLVAEDFFPSVTKPVIEILEQYAYKWAEQVQFQSILNKNSLQHEVEESIVALYYLLHEGQSLSSSKYIAIDVCGGKGLFSFLLSHLRPKNLHSIILIEKSTTINWSYLEWANGTCQQEHRPPVEIWADTNLHDYDLLLDRLLQLPFPVALTGIHLCKQLGPSFCGLVNGLGNDKCRYACLAPCCLPRLVRAQKGNKHHGDNLIKPFKTKTMSPSFPYN